MALFLASHWVNGWAVMEIKGELDTTTAWELCDFVTAVTMEHKHPLKLIADLTGLTYTDVDGLSTLMSVHTLEQNRGELRLVCPAGRVEWILHISGLARVFPSIPPSTRLSLPREPAPPTGQEAACSDHRTCCRTYRIHLRCLLAPLERRLRRPALPGRPRRRVGVLLPRQHGSSLPLHPTRRSALRTLRTAMGRPPRRAPSRAPARRHRRAPQPRSCRGGPSPRSACRAPAARSWPSAAAT